MIEKLKNLRVEIDKWAQAATQLSNMPDNYKNSQEIKDCIKSLYYAKAWIGKLCGYMGYESPYKNDGNRKEVKDIEPTDSVYELTKEDDGRYPMETHIERVDFLRQQLNSIIVNICALDTEHKFTWETGQCQDNAYKHICEARFALGFEMQRIRERV